jgi:flagellar hook assembly protein FlgD
VKDDGVIEIGVFDLSGRLVRNLVSGPVPAGQHEVIWNGRDDWGRSLPNGLYFVRLSDFQGQEARRVVVSR